MRSRMALLAAVSLSALVGPAAMSEPPGRVPGPRQVRAAALKALAPIEKSAVEYTRQRGCFSCHHQGVPLVALSLARSRGLAVDAGAVQQLLEFTEASLRGGRDGYREGRGQGGQVDTAGYALFALEAGGWKPDETTGAVAEYLLRQDADQGHWRATANRPPSEISPFAATFVAVRGLSAFAGPDQKERMAERVRKAREWLLSTAASDTEDRVFRLWALEAAGAGAPDVASAAKELSGTQQADGGWAQAPGLESDAYATGSALVALRQAGGVARADRAYGRGIGFLIGSQQPDGTWHVVSRSKPFQTYFESGFPYRKDQFISMAGSAWAAAALVLALPPAK